MFHGPRLGGSPSTTWYVSFKPQQMGGNHSGGRSSVGETLGEGREQARLPCATDRRDRGTGWSDPPSTFHKQPRVRCGSIPCIVRGVDVTVHRGSPPTVLTRRNGSGRRGRENTSQHRHWTWNSNTRDTKEETKTTRSQIQTEDTRVRRRSIGSDRSPHQVSRASERIRGERTTRHSEQPNKHT